MTKIIAVDLGTTFIKCILYDEAGRTLASESLPCHLTYPAQDRVEQNAELWYDGVCEAISRLISFCDVTDVRSISISSQGISVVPVDKDFHPLRNAISWLDTRTEYECSILAHKMVFSEWFRRTGKFLSPAYTLSKLLWMKKNEPEIFSSAYKFLLPMDYVNLRMTGNAVTDHTMAAGTMGYDIELGNWASDLLEFVGITEEKLAKILPSGALVGAINEETAQRTGLNTKTLVFNGGQDQKIAAFGASINKHRGSLSLGTAGALEIFVEDAKRQEFLPFFPYITPGTMLVEGCINTTGAAIQWFKNTIAPEISFDTLNQLANESPIGSNGVWFYPHLGRPGTPHHGRNEYGSIREIALGTTRGDLMRSLYEGLAFEIRLNLENAKKAGSALNELSVFGGASKSSVFCQIIANVTGLRVTASENGEMGSVGAAKLALQGLGLDAESFARTAAGTTKTYLPEDDSMRQYDKLYQNYTKVYESEE